MESIISLGAIIYLLVKIAKAWYRHDIKGESEV